MSKLLYILLAVILVLLAIMCCTRKKVRYLNSFAILFVIQLGLIFWTQKVGILEESIRYILMILVGLLVFWAVVILCIRFKKFGAASSVVSFLIHVILYTLFFVFNSYEKLGFLTEYQSFVYPWIKVTGIAMAAGLLWELVALLVGYIGRRR